MQITFDCPKCLQHTHGEVSAASTGVMCPDCHWIRPIGDGDLAGETPCRCLVCGCDDLWRQKDFPQQLGLVIVGLGILFSTIAMAYMRPGLSLGILMAIALADMVLYAVMKDCLVCYRCHARYRRVPNLQQVQIFDLEINERYRQEAIRLNQLQQSSTTH